MKVIECRGSTIALDAEGGRRIYALELSQGRDDATPTLFVGGEM